MEKTIVKIKCAMFDSNGRLEVVEIEGEIINICGHKMIISDEYQNPRGCHPDCFKISDYASGLGIAEASSKQACMQLAVSNVSKIKNWDKFVSDFWSLFMYFTPIINS